MRVMLIFAGAYVFIMLVHCSEGDYSNAERDYINDESVIGLSKEDILKKFGNPTSFEASPFEVSPLEANPDDKLADSFSYEWWYYADKVIYFNRHGKVIKLKELK